MGKNISRQKNFAVGPRPRKSRTFFYRKTYPAYGINIYTNCISGVIALLKQEVCSRQILKQERKNVKM